MALEKSVLTAESMRQLLEQHYGLRIVRAQRLGLGTANCFRVDNGRRSWFLKEFQTGFSEDDLTREAQLLDALHARGVPVVLLLPTSSGLPFVRFGGHIFCLQPYIEAAAYSYADFPPEMMLPAARMLGTLHRAMQGMALPEDMGAQWLDAFSAEGLAAQYERLLARAEGCTQDANRARLCADLCYKRDLALRCGRYISCFDGITRCATHGDYQGCQLLCADGAIRAVVDFSAARVLPVVWEIMRSFVQSSAECRRSAKIDIAQLCGYVREYMRVAPLTPQDLRAMPYVYLFQLARSKYGFVQYLQSDSEDREDLVRFAFWRTDICRELERCAPAISQALADLQA